MMSITMTELNQRVSAVTRQVIESGEAVQVTNRGRVVLRLVPEPPASDDPVDALVALGQAAAPTRPHRRLAGRRPVQLSAELDDLLDEARADVDI
jgi:antitoxin (DNA-binding transcriptional repressor) of toxin-antitoxin stability system